MLYRLALTLLLVLLAACSAQPPTQPLATPVATIASEPAATTIPIVTIEPTLPPTTAPAPPAETQTAVPLIETHTPQDVIEPDPTLEPAVFVRTIQVQNPPIDGDDVRAVQNRLLALGYIQLGEADGIFGANTALAVRAFQARNRLDVDGIIGPQSWQLLFGVSPMAAEGAGPLIPIVDGTDGYLLGASRDRRWVPQLDAGALLAGGESYTVQLPDGSIASAQGTQPGSMGTPCEQSMRVGLDPDPGQGIAVGTGVNPRPRVARTGDTADPDVIAAIQKVLQEQGIAEPVVQITYVLIADLDNDGTDEQVVAATRMSLIDPGVDSPSPDAGAGDYSLLVVLSQKQPAAIVLGRIFPEAATFVAPEIFELLDLLDLNGDGQLEIVASAVYYEGGSVLAFDQIAGKYQDVIGNGCGV
jgi:hypothetical protein